MSYYIGPRCSACHYCFNECPVQAIRFAGTSYEIDEFKCIGCGKCEKLCPMNNITLPNGRPVWGDNCTQCMACICYCPTEAIEYGKKSLGKPRYRFEKL